MSNLTNLITPVQPRFPIYRYRRAAGVRISWDCGRPLSMAQNWNPLARDIPFVTLTSHSLFWEHAEQPGQSGDMAAVVRGW